MGRLALAVAIRELGPEIFRRLLLAAVFLVPVRALWIWRVDGPTFNLLLVVSVLLFARAAVDTFNRLGPPDSERQVCVSSQPLADGQACPSREDVP